jgi:hypothetical protein
MDCRLTEPVQPTRAAEPFERRAAARCGLRGLPPALGGFGTAVVSEKGLSARTFLEIGAATFVVLIGLVAI